MEFTDREVLITVVERLRGLEKRQREDKKMLLQVAHAFQQSHTDNAAKYHNCEGLARKLLADEGQSDDLDLLYGDILQRLKVSKDQVE